MSSPTIDGGKLTPSPEGSELDTIDHNDLLAPPYTPPELLDGFIVTKDTKMEVDAKVLDPEDAVDFDTSTVDEGLVRDDLEGEIAHGETLDSKAANSGGDIDEIRIEISTLAITRIQKPGSRPGEERLMETVNAGKWRINDEYGTVHCGGTHAGNDPAKEDNDACQACSGYYAHIGRDIVENDESLQAVLALRNLWLAPEEGGELDGLYDEITRLKIEVSIADENAQLKHMKIRRDVALTENNGMKSELAEIQEENNERPRKRPSVASISTHYSRDNDNSGDVVMHDVYAEEYDHKKNRLRPPEHEHTSLPPPITAHWKIDLDDIHFEAPPL
ncbi:hypothetical protein C8R43DRAFT_1133940 [Mycena crocata]|nr:hypothetical protein C8R43DRAFT_1133940 [Mycena crocata]